MIKTGYSLIFSAMLSSEPLARFYRAIGDDDGQKLDLKRIKRERPKIAKLLRDHAAQDTDK